MVEDMKTEKTNKNSVARSRYKEISNRRAEYVPCYEFERMYQNTVGYLNRAVLKMLYGTFLKTTEMSQLKVKDVVQAGCRFSVTSKFKIPANISYNGVNREVKLSRDCVIAIGEYLEHRNGLKQCVLTNGHPDPESNLLLRNDGKPFLITRRATNGGTSLSAKGLNELIQELHKNNGIPGGVDNGRRTLTINMYRECIDPMIIMMMRGDASIDTVQNIVEHSPRELTDMNDYAY